MANVRLIVLNYKRPDNVYNIINTYTKLLPISVVNNNPEEPFPYLGNGIDVINNEKNWMCMERWVRCFDYDEPYKFIIDDDLLPHPSLLKKMYNKNLPIVGVYGKSGVSTANSYDELKDHWNKDAKVDFLVGAVNLVKQSALDLIQKDIEKIGYPKRGDDIIVSYLLKKYLNLKYLDTVAGKVLNLPEDNVGLNTDKQHYNMRWDVVERFKKISN
jgi:hypothetical protein|tara:strand:+ start:303 stop:947 length:645 start_codon:yes stop_codon:yes gene_type:complete